MTDSARGEFLRRMEALMPWARLEARIRPVYPTGEYPLALRLRIHCVQLFYNLSDPAMDSTTAWRCSASWASPHDPRPDDDDPQLPLTAPAGRGV